LISAVFCGLDVWKKICNFWINIYKHLCKLTLRVIPVRESFGVQKEQENTLALAFVLEHLQMPRPQFVG
jgi:hypothetical protein